MGTKLLNRTTKTIEVTDAGWKVYQYASQILELEEYVQQACSGNVRRILRIGATVIPATYILPGVLQQYRELYPNDCLKVMECEKKAVIDGVLDNRFDAGLIGQSVRKDGLICTPLCCNQPILITPVTERYLKMRQMGAPVAELLKEPVILREKGDDFFPDQMGIDPENLRIVARVNDYETVKNMVSGGMGISVIPEIAARDFLKSRQLLKFDLPRFRQTQNVYLIYPDGCTTKDSIWNFIDYLLESNDLINQI